MLWSDLVVVVVVVVVRVCCLIYDVHKKSTINYKLNYLDVMMLLIRLKALIYVRSGLAILTTCCHCQSSKLKKTFVVFSTSGKSKICFIFTKLMTKLVLQNFG